MEIFKFGGLSTRDADAVRRVTEIVRNNLHRRPLVVFSAMGKTTRKLESVAAHAWQFKTEAALADYESFQRYHEEIIQQLGISRENKTGDMLQDVFTEVKQLCQNLPRCSFDCYYDNLVSNGELIASLIMSAYFDKCGVTNTWIDIRDVLITDNNFRAARPDMKQSAPLMRGKFLRDEPSNGVFITQGFIARSESKHTTTLGLDGSDYTAALLASALDAEKLTVWKDVEGVMNADPKYFSPAEKISCLTYLDAVELAFYGANVIHPKTIKPLQNKSIPLEVKSFLRPENEGTIIGPGLSNTTVPAIIFKTDQVLLTISSRDFSFIVEENLRDIFDIFSHLDLKINLMKNSAISFTVCFSMRQEKVPALLTALEEKFRIESRYGLELVTVRNYDAGTLERAVRGRKKVLEVTGGAVAQCVVEN